MPRLLPLALLLISTPALAQAPAKYWIRLTTEPGVEGLGRIVGGYAVDIEQRRSVGAATVQPATTQLTEADAFLFALNAWRASRGRGPVAWDANLAAFATGGASNHPRGSFGNASGQCWAGTSSLTAALTMWQASPAHASILLNATHAVGAARCVGGMACNAR